jgi:hypothetical protein
LIHPQQKKKTWRVGLPPVSEIIFLVPLGAWLYYPNSKGRSIDIWQKMEKRQVISTDSFRPG